MSNLNLDVRVFPISEPKGSTVAFANVTFCAENEPVSAINGIRLVNGENGAFVTMPQTSDSSGEYRDVAFPVMKGLRGSMSKAIFAEFDAAVKSGGAESAKEPHMHLGGKLPENSADLVSADAKMKPIRNPRGNTLAFGSVTLKIGDTPFSVIENVRVVSGENGLFAVMPQSQDNNGKYHDVAFPVMKGLRGKVTEAVLESYKTALGELDAAKSSRFSERLAAGGEKSAEYKQNSPDKAKSAKASPGLGDD